MKKPLLLIILTVGSVLNSCKLDDSADDADLLGSWSYIAYIDEEGEEVTDDCESQNIIRFKNGNIFDYEHHYKNKTGDECVEGTHSSGTWSYLFDKKVQLNYGTNDNPDITIAKYTISGNELTLRFDDGNGKYKEMFTKK